MRDRNLIPTVSEVLEDGTLVELVFDGAARTTALAIKPPTDAPSIASAFKLSSGEQLVPYSPTNNLIATGCVLLPSGIGALEEKAALVDEVRAFIHRYVDLSPDFEEIAAHYVLLTWVYDAFNEMPYLRLRGDFGTGKTRALLVIGSLCYKPFFASGASTVSPIFHVLEAFAGTLILDEADLRFSDATADLTKILNNGSVRGLPVLRTMTNRHRELNPQAFRVFGPKIIAMRRSFSDAALESRFITEDTGRRSLRAGIPIHVPPELHAEAGGLRDKLLAWRFAERHRMSSDPTRLLGDLSPRASQTALSLLSVIDDAEVREAVCSYVGVGAERLRRERRLVLEPLLLAAVLAAYEREGTAGAAIGVITQLFNEDAAGALGAPATPRWIGEQVRTLLGLKTLKTNGVYAVPNDERPHVVAMAERFCEPFSPEISPKCSPDEQSTPSTDEQRG